MSKTETVAVGFDGSPHAEAALAWALGLAGALGARVVVVHAVGLLEAAAGSPGLYRLEGAVRGAVAQSFISEDRVRWEALDGSPTSVLTRASDPPIDADLVVVGSRGAGAHQGRLLGSTSLELAEQSRVPVMIVPLGDPVARGTGPG